LDGKAFGAQPELEVDRFLKLLRSDARFSAMIEDIQLRSIARVTETDKSNVTREAAGFAIECWYKAQVTK
jgi:L-fucose isomerase-like protein